MNKPNEKKIEKLAIIGTGQMGSGVAQVSLPVCDTVLMKDISLDAVSKGMDTVYNSLQKLVQKNKLIQFQAEALYGKMLPCDDYRYFKNTDLVIEAVVEDLALKQKILHEVESATGQTSAKSQTIGRAWRVNVWPIYSPCAAHVQFALL